MLLIPAPLLALNTKLETMSLDSETLALLTKEEELFKEIESSIEEQIIQAKSQLQNKSIKAKRLTSELVATRREEEKQQLASDEAVSHNLRDLKKDELKNLDSLKDKPYFAHLILDEDDGRKIEFFLGTTSNSDCRIIDWRKAPISKLYYEYKEGEEYFEEIQGRDRSGKITLRNKIDIEKGSLKRISCRYGTFYSSEQGWQLAAGSGSNQGVSSRNYGKLPDVLSLITAEQFRTITEDSQTAILIQGIAGSGKTTVALHRLAWLLHEDNSDLKAKEAVIVVRSSALRAYIAAGQDSLDLGGVPVLTFKEWCNLTLARSLPLEFSVNGKIKRPNHPTPTDVRRVLAAIAILKVFEIHCKIKHLNNKTGQPLNIIQVLLDTLRDTESILAQENLFFIDKDTLELTADYLERMFYENLVDPAVDGLLVHATKLVKGQIMLPSQAPGLYRHIIVDEVQDFTAAELAALVGGVNSLDQLTLVGDSSQAIGAEGAFIGWEKLRQHWNLGSEHSRFVSLTVSHRSTLPIMRLADFVSGHNRTQEGKPGNPPIWFHCCDENQGVSEALSWLTRVTEKFPDSLSVVLCRTMKEATYVYSLLKPTFQHGVRLGDDNSFSFEEGIVVSSVAMVKGLEFPHVLIWNPSAINYSDTPRHRNMLYVAITRAEDHLCLVTWNNPSPLLPSLYSKFVRGYDRVTEAKEMAQAENEEQYSERK